MIRNQQTISPFANIYCPHESYILDANKNICCKRPYCPFLHSISKDNVQTSKGNPAVSKIIKEESVEDNDIIVLFELPPKINHQILPLSTRDSTTTEVTTSVDVITDSKRDVNVNQLYHSTALSNHETTAMSISEEVSSKLPDGAYIGYVAASSMCCTAKPSPHDNYDIEDENGTTNNNMDNNVFASPEQSFDIANASVYKQQGVAHFLPVVSVDETPNSNTFDEKDQRSHRNKASKSDRAQKKPAIPPYIPTPIAQLEREKEARAKHKEMVERLKRIRDREIEQQRKEKIVSQTRNIQKKQMDLKTKKEHKSSSNRKRVIIEEDEDEESDQNNLSSALVSRPIESKAGKINSYVKCVAQLDKNIEDMRNKIRKSNNKLAQIDVTNNVKKKGDAAQKLDVNEKIPVWRKPENVNSFDNMIKTMQDDDFERACRKSTETIIDTLFGTDEEETATVPDGSTKKRRISTSSWENKASDKKRSKMKTDEKSVEDPWTTNERQVLVDLLSDEDHVDGIAPIPPSTSLAIRKQSDVNSQRRTVTTIKSIPCSSSISKTTTENKKAFSSICSASTSIEQKTFPSTLKKGEQRKAHVAKPTISTSNNSKQNLVLLDPYNKKVSSQIRQARLAIIYAEYLKICSENPDMAVESAQYEEKAILDKCTGRLGYVAAVPNVIKRLRNFAATNGKHGKNSAISHQNVLLGRHVESVTVGLHRAQQVAQHKINTFSELDFYNVLEEKFLLSDEQLWANGYPRWTSVTMEMDNDNEVEDTAVEMFKQNRVVEIRLSELDTSKTRAQKPFLPDTELKRICARCGTEYQLKKDGQYSNDSSSDECVYHWGKAWKKRIQGSYETRYTCCDSSLDIRGCVVAAHHITQTLRLSTLEKYAETPKPFGIGDPRSKKVFALDCEMVYSVWGPEVARLTVVDVLGELILDVLIRPEHQLIDCNTRFSGLTQEQVENAECDFESARERFFELVNSETILIGHSLESDLRALRIVHNRVVDTSVVFPHRLGPPQKRALKTLASEILQLIIQEDVGGHDSKEDALACMRIMLKHCRR